MMPVCSEVLVRWLWRRYWPVVAVLAAATGIAVLYGVAEWLTPVDSARPHPGPTGPNYSRIEDGLYLGGTVDEPPPGTRAVLNVCEMKDAYEVEVHRWDPIPDAEPASSLDWLRKQVDFIDTQRRAGRPVYVHCAAGISRGPMVTAAHLMTHKGWTRDQALTFLADRRPGIAPNFAFMTLLLEWERAHQKPILDPLPLPFSRAPATFSMIEDGFYVGGSVPKPPEGTRAVLNVCEIRDLYEVEVHRWDPIPDAAPAPSLDWLRKQVEFIDDQRRAGRPVYVHCSAGISRGPMVAAAYLMARHGWTRDEAIAFLSKKRGETGPIRAFMALLLEWEKSLKK